MSAGCFPSDPSNRKAIVVLKQHDVERCSYESGGGRWLIDDEAYVLQFPVSEQGQVAMGLQNILDARQARPGVILVQSPFDSEVYEDASVAADRFALTKHMYFSLLCMHLGAKEVSVEQVDLRTSTGKSSWAANADRAGFDAILTASSEELEKFRAQMSLKDIFTGGKPDLDAAEKLLRKTGLLSDSNMNSLLEMRRSTSNKILSRKLVINLSSEAKSNLNIVARLKSPLVNLSIDYENIASKECDYTVTVLVQF